MSRPRCHLSAASLREHLRAGLTHAQIATVEGLTVDQVSHRIRQLGLAKSRPLPPAPVIQALLEVPGTHRVDIAKMFGVSPAAVTLRLKRAVPA